MSATSGPDIVSDSLVFYYDTGNSRDSYKGEPTENIVTNPTFLGTSGTQTSAISQNWYFSGYDGDTGFKFHNSSTSPIPLKFPNEGAVITTGPNGSTNRRIYYNSTVESNTTYTLSYWLYSSAYGSISNYFFIYQADGTDAGSTSYGQGITTGKWVFIKQSFTTPSITSNTRNVYWGPVISFNTDSLFAMQRFQIEAKAHATPFTIGTRSSTQGLLDISGQGTSIDISNASFDSNAQMTFDGTGDYFDVDGIADFQPNNTTNGFTVEYVYNSETVTSTVFVGNLDSTNGWFQAPISTGNNIGAYLYLNGPGVALTTNDNFYIDSGNINKYHHIVMSLKWSDSANSFIMVDGVDQTASRSSVAKQSTSGVPSPGLRIGKRGSSIWPANGQIPVVKYYNRALTAAEAKQNYDSIKARFGLI